MMRRRRPEPSPRVRIAVLAQMESNRRDLDRARDLAAEANRSAQRGEHGQAGDLLDEADRLLARYHEAVEQRRREIYDHLLDRALKGRKEGD